MNIFRFSSILTLLFGLCVAYGIVGCGDPKDEPYGTVCSREFGEKYLPISLDIEDYLGTCNWDFCITYDEDYCRYIVVDQQNTESEFECECPCNLTDAQKPEDIPFIAYMINNCI